MSVVKLVIGRAESFVIATIELAFISSIVRDVRVMNVSSSPVASNRCLLTESISIFDKYTSTTVELSVDALASELIV